MLSDRAFDEVVHTVLAEVPARVKDTREDMLRMAREMEAQKPLPPMRRAGCYGFSPCPFLQVCHGPYEPVPSIYGFRRKSDWTQEVHAFTPGPEPDPESPGLGQMVKIEVRQVQRQE